MHLFARSAPKGKAFADAWVNQWFEHFGWSSSTLRFRPIGGAKMAVEFVDRLRAIVSEGMVQGHFERLPAWCVVAPPETVAAHLPDWFQELFGAGGQLHGMVLRRDIAAFVSWNYNDAIAGNHDVHARMPEAVHARIVAALWMFGRVFQSPMLLVTADARRWGYSGDAAARFDGMRDHYTRAAGTYGWVLLNGRGHWSALRYYCRRQGKQGNVIDWAHHGCHNEDGTLAWHWDRVLVMASAYRRYCVLPQSHVERICDACEVRPVPAGDEAAARVTAPVVASPAPRARARWRWSASLRGESANAAPARAIAERQRAQPAAARHIAGAAFRLGAAVGRRFVSAGRRRSVGVSEPSGSCVAEPSCSAVFTRRPSRGARTALGRRR